MLQGKAESQANYDRFVRRVKEQGEVWGLKLEDSGWAQCPSHEQEGMDVLVFWSDRAYAARHQKEQWEKYVPTAVPLDEFIDSWLRGMHDDGVLVGLNWDANLCGLELTALEVAQRLTEN